MSDCVAQQRVLAEIDPVALVDLASALIRIPSFRTEETPVARFLAQFFSMSRMRSSPRRRSRSCATGGRSR